MYIKASVSLRNDNSTISKLAKETKEPIYVTKSGEGDLVLMSIEAFEKRERVLELRDRVLQAEQERLNGENGKSIAEVRSILRNRMNEI